MKLLVTGLLALLPTLVSAQDRLSPPAVPELTLDLYDLRIEPEQVHFRFTYEGPEQSFDTLEPTFHWLCETVAARVLRDARMRQTNVVVAISPEPVAFGEATDVLQFFEAFRVDGFECVWEYF